MEMQPKVQYAVLKAVTTLDPEPTQHKSGQTPDKEVDINYITVYVSGCIETDTTGMLSPNNGRLSGTNKVVLFRTDSLARYLMHCAQDSSVVATDKMYLIELFRDVTPHWDQRDKNYRNKDLKPKTLG